MRPVRWPFCDQAGLTHVSRDKELKEMVKTTHVEVLAEELDQARAPEEEAPPPESDGK